MQTLQVFSERMREGRAIAAEYKEVAAAAYKGV